ncbi:hypothetical protein [Paenibacillus senegalensis]|uniref:hypothetical protein n=1 Tax=Paenibacillus senegalensis TaxID=1465766 RepID=UPI00138AB6C7|nr:hypothetical protein [Paenibacillus senegalensis]
MERGRWKSFIWRWSSISILDQIQRLMKVIVFVNFSFLRFRHKLNKERLTMDTLVLLITVASVGVFLMSYYVGIMNKWYLYFQHAGMDTGFLLSVLWIFHSFLLLTGSFFVLHLFCFSKDSSALLYLPLKSEVLLLSKLLVVILSGYVLALILLVPPLILYGIDHASLGYAAAALMIVAASPLMPLTLLGTIALLALKLSDIWKKSPGLIAAIGHLLLLLTAGFITGRFLGAAGIGDRLIAWSRLEAPEYGLLLFLYLGLSGAALYLFWLLARRLFPSGLTLSSAAGRQSHAARLPDATFTGRHRFFSYFQKEWRLFFREPVYVLNGMFGAVLPPLLLPLSFQMSSMGGELDAIRRIASQEQYAFMATIVALAIIVVTSGINVVASSSVSREGRHYWLCQLIPLPYW